MSSQIIAYYIENMASKEFIEALFNQYGLRYRKSYSYRKYKDTYIESGVNINMDEFTEMCRNSWISAPIDYHKANLSSGALIGHSWHRARPSKLHYSLQDKVRECISTNASLDNLLEVGRDIMKHEYFMVATHDICESLIIRDIPTCLPPTRKKSISDFIFSESNIQKLCLGTGNLFSIFYNKEIGKFNAVLVESPNPNFPKFSYNSEIISYMTNGTYAFDLKANDIISFVHDT